MMDSLCNDMFSCARYAHRHCVNCREILYGVGGGGDDGRGVAGYEDDLGAAIICTECRDDDFMLCGKCAAQDSRCPSCRADKPVAA